MTNDKKTFDNDNDANLDPITGEPGAHPVGTGVGAAGAGAVGTAVGAAVGGPVGAAIGAVVGAVAGGLAGKSAAERINPTVEDEYWRNNYTSQPYFEKDYDYTDYQPAYRAGYEGYGRYGDSGRTYDDVEPDLRRDYERDRGDAGLAWDKAKFAAKDAWHRIENAFPDGDDRHNTDRRDTVVDNQTRRMQNDHLEDLSVEDQARPVVDNQTPRMQRDRL
jgi:hypothetical protein